MTSTTGIVLLLIVVLILHLIEEVGTGFRKRLPIGEMSLPLFVGTNVIVYAFCLSTLFLAERNGHLATPFAWGLAVAMLLNGLGHVGIMVVRRQYFPGGLSALALVVLSAYLMLHLSNMG